MRTRAITAEKFAANLLNPLTWLLNGNAGVTNGFLGTTDDQPLEFRVNGRRAMRYTYAENILLATRSINVLGGSNINNIATGILGATIAGGGGDRFTGQDYPNTINADFGTIGGGDGNTVNGFAATIAGGRGNISSNTMDTVGGGFGNVTDGYLGTISGGFLNVISNPYATVGGGDRNAARGEAATIGGGSGNIARGNFATIGGGRDNRTDNGLATVGGGYGNTASGIYATVVGGCYNTASGLYSFAAGQQAWANHEGSFVWSDASDTTFRSYFASTGNNQFLIRAMGGVGINTNEPAGYALNVNGNAQVTHLTQTSDARYKQNITPFENALDTLLNLRGVTFDWKRNDYPARHFSEGKQIGFIAQEVEKVLPELVTTDSKGYKSVAYSNLVPVLVEAVKTLNRKVERLQILEKTNTAIRAENAELKATLQALLQRVEQLEKRHNN